MKQRKSLRERVADRKAGIREEIDPRRKRIIRWVELGANLFQGIGIIMLLVVVVRYLNGNYAHMNWINVMIYSNWINVMIYSGMFLTGRAVISFMNLSRKIR